MRSRKPYQVNLLMGGFDDIEKIPILHAIDYMGSDVECPYGAHGHGAMFTMSILDRHYNK
jgi:20S proteasome subunit beta 4